MSTIQTFSLSASSRKLIVLSARLAISRALSISDSCSWNDMYWIQRHYEFGDPTSTRSKSLLNSAVFGVHVGGEVDFDDLAFLFRFFLLGCCWSTLSVSSEDPGSLTSSLGMSPDHLKAAKL